MTDISYDWAASPRSHAGRATVEVARRKTTVGALSLGAAPRSAGTPYLVPLDALRPTQMAVGMRAVDAKRRKLESRGLKPKRIARFLEARPIPTVKGPANELFIVDHHHLGLALLRADVDRAFVSIIGDLSGLPRRRFWARMEAAGLLHPYDEMGRRVAPADLPSALAALRADPYRDLAWSVREAGGYEKSRVPFAEFHWANYFRALIEPARLKRDYEATVRRAMRLARRPGARGLPGFIGD
jgi:hypothetical protein